jgi:phosphoglycerate dehydrogenase-like enzyme
VPDDGGVHAMPKALMVSMLFKNSRGQWRDILENAGFEVAFPDDAIELMHPEKLKDNLCGIDAVLAGMEPFTRSILEQSQLRVIARLGVGYDAIDIPAATEQGVAVTITAGANDQAVAEHTVAMMLAVARGFPSRDMMVRRGDWRRLTLGRLAGKTLGLIGLGRIGRSVVPKAQGIGMTVIATDPLADRAFADRHDVRLCSLDELLAESDVVSVHAPNTPDTENLINARTLARMKKGSILVNTARGNLVDEDALIHALNSGHLMGAALDVFKVEPLPLTSPLVSMENVLLAPHMAGLDHESQSAMANMAAQSIVDLHQGRWPEGCVVNDSLRGRFRW